eukprot:GHVT01013512.1.p1 GENE.GHVT01013512.1~~GHVT01013512.1.p1  ORF type:complete len:145 (-),score=14.39 GHVT01013512.1:1723-2157(-)
MYVECDDADNFYINCDDFNQCLSVTHPKSAEAVNVMKTMSRVNQIYVNNPEIKASPENFLFSAIGTELGDGPQLWLNTGTRKAASLSCQLPLNASEKDLKDKMKKPIQFQPVDAKEEYNAEIRQLFRLKASWNSGFSCLQDASC